jgi:hypothetical protein
MSSPYPTDLLTFFDVGCGSRPDHSRTSHYQHRTKPKLKITRPSFPTNSTSQSHHFTTQQRLTSSPTFSKKPSCVPPQLIHELITHIVHRVVHPLSPYSLAISSKYRSL